MTPCSICGQPTVGTDDDDAPCCGWCYADNLAGADIQPVVRRDRDGRLRLVDAWRLVLGDGRDGAPPGAGHAAPAPATE